MYCLLSQIINAAIYAAVPSHNRWPISTQLLFMRLSQPSAVPQAPNRRDGEITLSLGGPESYHLWGIHRVGALWIGSYCQFCCGITRTEAQKQERLNCSVISLLCSGNLWCVIWERPPEGGRKRLASNKTLSAVCRGTSLFIFFFLSCSDFSKHVPSSYK